MEADQLGRLQDILESAQFIAAYINGVNLAAFRADNEKQDAVVRRIEIIGEASRHLSGSNADCDSGIAVSQDTRHAQHCGP